MCVGWDEEQRAQQVSVGQRAFPGCTHSKLVGADRSQEPDVHMTLTLGRREAVPQGSDVTQGLAQVQRGLPHQCASPIGFWGGASASLEVSRGEESAVTGRRGSEETGRRRGQVWGRL